MTHKICFKAATKEISVLPLATAVPVGFTNIGNYIHDTGGDPLGAAVSHVLYHHIRDALYQVGVQDMAYIDITFTSEVGAPPVTCAFPLNALADDLIPLGIAGRLVLSNSDQTGTYVYQGGLVAEVSNGAAPAGLLATGTRIEFSTGNKTIEAGFAIQPTIGTNDFGSGILGSARFYDATGSNGVVAQISCNDVGEYTTSVIIITDNAQFNAYVSPTGPTYPATLAIGISAGVLSAWADGVPITLSATGVTGTDLLPLLSTTEFPGLDVANLGRSLSVTLRTDSTTYLHTYAGRTDACGTSVAA